MFWRSMSIPSSGMENMRSVEQRSLQPACSFLMMSVTRSTEKSVILNGLTIRHYIPGEQNFVITAQINMGIVINTKRISEQK
jgi:hypothetical protein